MQVLADAQMLTGPSLNGVVDRMAGPSPSISSGSLPWRPRETNQWRWERLEVEEAHDSATLQNTCGRPRCGSEMHKTKVLDLLVSLLGEFDCSIG